MHVIIERLISVHYNCNMIFGWSLYNKNIVDLIITYYNRTEVMFLSIFETDITIIKVWIYPLVYDNWKCTCDHQKINLG